MPSLHRNWVKNYKTKFLMNSARSDFSMNLTHSWIRLMPSQSADPKFASNVRILLLQTKYFKCTQKYLSTLKWYVLINLVKSNSLAYLKQVSNLMYNYFHSKQQIYFDPQWDLSASLHFGNFVFWVFVTLVAWSFYNGFRFAKQD